MDGCKPLTRGSSTSTPTTGSTSATRGRAVQVDPMKPKLKPPGTKRLKLEYDGLLSNFGFKFNLRRYTVGD